MIRGSVRARLAVWHTLTLAAVLAAFSLGTYAYIVRSSVRRVDDSLAETVASFVQRWTDELSEEASSIPEAAGDAVREFRYRDRRVLVYDAADALVAASDTDPLISGLTPAAFRTVGNSPVAALASAAAPGDPAVTTLSTAESRIRAMAMRVSFGGRPFTIVVLRSLKAEEEIQGTYAEALLVLIPLALVLAGVGGYFLARGSLAPMAEITAHAERIGESNLDERLSVPNPHDEMGRLAAVLNSLLSRLQRAFEQRRQFMADASHELRTPVAAFRSAADVALARPTRAESEYRDALSVISGEGRRLSRLVDSLFLLARADAGEQPVRKEPLYLEEALADCARSARALGAAHNVRVEFAPADEAPLDADAALLERLLMNLLDNAVKHSPSGGVVRLTLARESVGAGADANGAAGVYRIEVRDSGPGVPGDAQPFIFDRFYRADTARSREASARGESDRHASGAGLGLAIARWVAEVHGGSLTLEESGPSGSLFVVRLPVDAGSAGGPVVRS